MKSVLAIDRKVVFPDDAVLHMVIWRLPVADTERPHGLKYRSTSGIRVVRYDNERGFSSGTLG
ncbi:MAG: toxin-antitoxin system TumE family protein [Gammaproteobacteria bacterium]